MAARTGCVRHPDPALRIEGAAVGTVTWHVGPYPSVGEAGVVLDVEREVPGTGRLADDERATVGRDHRAVRELEPGGGHFCRPVRPDQREIGEAARRLRLLDVEAEVADVGVALPVDHHVVRRGRCDRRQVGVQAHLAVAVDSPDLAGSHRHHQEITGRQPAETTRLVVQLDLHPLLTARSEREHVMLEEVRHPQSALVPPGPLTEVQTGMEDLHLTRHVLVLSSDLRLATAFKMPA